MMYCDSSIVAINCLCHLGIVLIGNCGLKCIKYFINAQYIMDYVNVLVIIRVSYRNFCLGGGEKLT